MLFHALNLPGNDLKLEDIMMFNVGIIGCGKMGQVHAEIFSAYPNCQVTGLYNRSIEKAQVLQKKIPGAVVYSSWQEMLADDQIQIIAISTPQYQRLEQYQTAMKYNKHIFAEKPVSLGLDDLKELMIALQDYQFCFYVDSQLRSHPAIHAINRELHRIGRIFHIDMEFSMFREEIKWKNKLLAGGGILRELCSHLIDQANEWLGECRSVCSNNKIILSGRENEDYSVNLIEYKNGATLMLSSNYFEHKGKLYVGRILGELGQIDFQFSSYNPQDSSVTLYVQDEKIVLPVEIPGPSDINSIYPGHMDSFKKEITRFMGLVETNQRAMDTLEIEWQATQIISASYESTRIDQKIFLPLESFPIENLKDCFRRF